MIGLGDRVICCLMMLFLKILVLGMPKDRARAIVSLGCGDVARTCNRLSFNEQQIKMFDDQILNKRE